MTQKNMDDESGITFISNNLKLSILTSQNKAFLTQKKKPFIFAANAH